MRQVARGLLGAAQAVAAQEGVIDEEPEIIRLQRDAARGLAVKKSHEFDRRGAASSQITHEEVSGDAGVDEALNQQNVFAHNVEFVAEENLEHGGLRLIELLVARLDEGADHGHVDGARQVGHEHETVFKDAESDDGLAAIVVGNLAAQFADSFLDLIGRNDLAQGMARRRGHGESRIAFCSRESVFPGGVGDYPALRFRGDASS